MGLVLVAVLLLLHSLSKASNMDDTGKTHSQETAAESSYSLGKTQMFPEDDAGESETDMEGIGEDIMAWLSDDTLTHEVMKLLDDSCSPKPHKVRFIDDPYSSSLVFQTTPSSYVTINGNEESCGSSFSDCESSVMASVDMGGFRFGDDGMDGGAWKGMEEDEALARFLGNDFLLSDPF